MKKFLPLVLSLVFYGIQNLSAQCIDSPYHQVMQIVGYNNNVVENSAFQFGNFKWSFAPNSTRVTIVSDPTKTYSTCGRLISTNTAGGDAWLGQNMPDLVAGDTVTMSAYLRKRSGASASLNVTLQVKINYPGGSSSIMSQLFHPTGNWARYSFQVVVPPLSNAQGAVAQVDFPQGQNDTVWVDSIQVTNPNIALNSDFETGISPWQQLPNTSRVLYGGRLGYKGSAHCMKLISLANSSGDALLVQNLPKLSNGQKYTISAYMKSAHPTRTNSDAANLHVRLNYAGGGQADFDTLVAPDSTWRRYSFTFTTPKTGVITASLLETVLYRGQNDSVFVDNFELINYGTIYNMVNTSVPCPPTGVFQDSFKGTAGHQLDFTKWLVVKKTWGANNNGVVPENIKLNTSGGVRFHGHGNLYGSRSTDTVYGAADNYGNGKIRVGACIATKNYYASGKYEIVAKVTPGLVDAFWTFHYIQDPNYQGGAIKNTEIDFEFPGAPTDPTVNPGYSGEKAYINDMNLNSWGGLCTGDGYDSSKRYNTSARLSDGFHTYTIDWHSGGGGVTPSVTFYVDGHFARRIVGSGYVPFRASRLWLGVWYSKYTWIAGPNPSDSALINYRDTFCEVKSVKITPYYETNDEYVTETDPAIGYVTPDYVNYPEYQNYSTSAWRLSGEPNEDQIQPPIEEGTEDDVKVGIDVPGHRFAVFLFSGNNDYITEINVINMSGQVLEKQNYPPGDQEVKITLPDSNMRSGVYLVQCTTSGGKIYYRKLLVMN